MEVNVRKWAQDAVEKLQLGKETGTKANKSLSITKERIKNANNSLAKANFPLISLNQQLQLIETVHDSFELNMKNKKESSDFLLRYMNDSIKQLNEKFDRLKAIKVDGSLSSSEPRLYDFISNEFLENLKLEYDYTDKLFNNVLDELEQMRNMLKGKLREFSVEFSDLEQVINSINESDWIDDSIEETIKLEEEIAGLIESLANHYDQCSKGVAIIEGKLVISDEEKKELFKVLENDYEEVPEVINDIEEIFGDIQVRCSKIDEFIMKNSFSSNLRKFSQKLSNFGERDLTSLVNLLNEHTNTLKSHTNKMNKSCDEAHKLIKNYEKFIRSYYSLILELERRKKAQRSVRDIINDAQSKVQLLQEEDICFRSSFKQNSGEYLPFDLWKDFSKDNPLVEISFRFEELPKLHESTISTAKSYFK